MTIFTIVYTEVWGMRRDPSLTPLLLSAEEGKFQDLSTNQKNTQKIVQVDSRKYLPLFLPATGPTFGVKYGDASMRAPTDSTSTSLTESFSTLHTP
mmetsp:Transcript_16073/g.32992  ORF Transcript_16073/g.32992 Transcript_16073/m.32992 type:complete len:96 (+) Transcript_16073:165-452(+)